MDSSLGLLGAIPKCVIYGPAGSGERWKELAIRAQKCMAMRSKEARLLEADRITQAYHSLIKECEDYERKTAHRE